MYSNGYYCQILTEPEFSRQIKKKYFDIKFYENSSSGSRIVPCGRRDGQKGRQTDRQTDMTELIVAFRTFANAPKIINLFR
jgi:hypothetical protein